MRPAAALTILKGFQGGASDGRLPYAALVSDGAGNLFGTTLLGGGADEGTVFTVKTNGTGFTVLHSFTASGADGGQPYGALVLDGTGTNLYGTTFTGGSKGAGTVFTMKTDGSGFAVLHSFEGGAADGSNPAATLVLDGAGNLYGTTVYGGTASCGIVFAVKTDGSGYTVLHPFAGGTSEGANPWAGLARDATGRLYGTTSSGGASGFGTVFSVKGDGDEFAVLHSFAGGAGDGRSPYGSLTLDGSGNLYGTTMYGGATDYGTVFTITTVGTGFAVLHSFDWSTADGVYPYGAPALDASGNLYGTTWNAGASMQGTVYTIKTNGTGFGILHSFAGNPSDGANPYSPIILDGSGNLFGASSSGGSANSGTAFTMKVDGTAYSVLHSFASAPAEGANPDGAPIFDGVDRLYGTARRGGSQGVGTIFTVKTNGTGFAVLHVFTGGPTDGAYPYGSLVLDGSGNLYGTTSSGGASGYGAVFTIKTNGSGFALLHSFSFESEGAWPYGSLVLDAAGNLYGMTYTGGPGGSPGRGTVYTLKTSGADFAVLHGFAAGTSDGANPYDSLVLDGSGNLYGTTTQGGASSQGTVFTIKTNGTGFALLHSFSGAANGSYPYTALVLDGAGHLYGTTVSGGSSWAGTVFTLETGGANFSVLHNFAEGTPGGMYPRGALVLDGLGTIYGTTSYGGDAGYGTVFTLGPDGSDFEVLHTFAGWATDGGYPYAGVVRDGAGNLYGTTEAGGPWNIGIVFKLAPGGDLSPQELTVAKVGAGSGVVTSDPGGISCGPACSAWFADSSVVILSASAASGSFFTGWSGEGCSGSGTCQVTMDGVRLVTATFCGPVVLSSQTITTAETYTSCTTMTMGPAFRVESPGDVTARAAVRVVLTNGFSVGSGGTFHAGLDPSLAP